MQWIWVFTVLALVSVVSAVANVALATQADTPQERARDIKRAIVSGVIAGAALFAGSFFRRRKSWFDLGLPVRRATGGDQAALQATLM